LRAHGHFRAFPAAFVPAPRCLKHVVAARRSPSFSTASGGERLWVRRPGASLFFWRQPSCRPAVFPTRQSPAACLPRSGTPSPSAAGPRASLPAPISIPIGGRTGRAARASGHQNRTVMLSYAEHGRSRAIVQERTSPTFSPPAKKVRKRALKLLASTVAASSSTTSCRCSGPRVVHKRKESRAHTPRRAYHLRSCGVKAKALA